VEISESDAHALLLYDLMPIEAAVNEWVFTPLTQNQFDALVSFAFNVGVKGFRTSEVLRRLNEGALLQAAATLEMWRQADLDGQPVVIDALVRRRAAEKALFLTPPGGHIAASSAVLRPQLDLSAYMAVPRNRPEEVSIPLEGEVAVVNRAGPDGLAEAIIPAAPVEEGDPEPLVAPAAPEPQAAPAPRAAEPEPQTSVPEPQAASPAPTVGEAEPAEDEPTEEPEDAADDDDTLVLPPFAGSPEPDPERDDEPDDATLAAARAAAAAVSARLHAILSSEDFVPEEDLPPAQPTPVRPAGNSEALQIAGEAEPIFPDEPEPEPEPQPAAIGEIHAFPRTDDVLVVDAESERPLAAGGLAPAVLTDEQAGTVTDEAAAHPPTGPYLLLGLVGLMFIVGALVVLFRSPAAADEAQDGASSVAWILALLGLAGVSGSLWFALRGEEEEDEGL
jgi:hypothetical protein